MTSEASFQPPKLIYKEKHSLAGRLITGPWQKLETVVWGVGKKPELIKGEEAEKVAVKFQVFALTEMGASEYTIQRTDWTRQALETPWHRKKPEVRWFEK
ncbi:MAG: hypothetical protein A2784_02615 [Candidatus Chisholmbacteria bacterium RIFCSPHIGHO2_01_FULL_48_12]|uniref:Uncharacterized protein n=1 Tax=Candidatus Chisholmbacteria bacterium RIFCSPHIGHO2_01_FULL_48_12 TaxID=1797589 RepID=A0A1G1VUV0_9BACT|nr:MAG: hypothetical protein A2784_02615 [Candidatus Chisholmbacteria bacterium RIFCSPHIGHO2_01_FULL_48_12]